MSEQQFKGLENGEVSYVIELLSAMQTIDEIKKRFFELAEPAKTISTKQIQEIALRYAKQIRDRNQAYLRNVDGSPLAHRRVRLDILNRVVQDASKQRPSYTIKTVNPNTNEEQSEVVYKADNATVISAVNSAAKDCLEGEKIEIMRAKELGKTDKDDDGEFVVDTGVA